MRSDPERALLLARQYDYERCRTNPQRFIQRHVTIEDPTGEIVPFSLWAFQRETLHALHHEPLLVVLKARRLGLSWLVLGYAMWLAIFQPGSRVVMLCKRQDDSREMVGRIKRMHGRMLNDPLHTHLVDGLKVERDATDRFEVGGSVFRALPATPAAARSETAALWVWDEAAFAEEGAEIMKGALPTIEGGGRAVIVSTGNGELGMGAEFARQYRRAVSGESGWHPLFWPWNVRPGRDEAWRRRTIAQLGAEERFRTEYPATVQDALHRAGALLIFDEKLIDRAVALEKPPLHETRLGVDVAREGRDLSTIYSWQYGRVRRVARGHWPDLMQTVGMVRAAAQELNAKQIIVDAVGLGAGVVDRLREADPNLDVVAFNGGSRAFDPERYGNRRAEVMWEMREAMRDGMLDLDGADEALLTELRSIAWQTDSMGRVVVESKDKLRARGLPSPDHVDAASMAALGLGRLGLDTRRRHTNGRRATITADLLDRAM